VTSLVNRQNLPAMYENHTEGRTAVKKLYEFHAEDCVRAAELTVDPRRREEFLKPGSRRSPFKNIWNWKPKKTAQS